MIIHETTTAKLKEKYRSLGLLLLARENNGNTNKLYDERIKIRREITKRTKSKYLSHANYRAKIEASTAEKFRNRGIIFDSL